MVNIVVNGRVLAQRITGVQRYLLEISGRLAGDCAMRRPQRPLKGLKGHLWEQFVLPFLVGRSLLWSPSNTGPLLRRHQVVTIHDMVPMDHPEWLSRNFAMFYRFLLPRLVLRVARIITDSEYSKSRILATTRVAAEKIVVIPLGVDPRFHPRPADVISATIAELNLPTRRYVLTVGSIEPRKNLRNLLAAWSLICGDLPDDLWLVVAGARGSAQVFAETAGMAALPPRVHLTGHVVDEHLPPLYAGASGFIYVSLYEGFGLPPLEAMASGVAVLVSNSTALPEVVGDCGLYADPLDIHEIARKIVQLMTDTTSSSQLARRGLERAKLFNWEACAEKTRAVLHDAAARAQAKAPR